MDLYGKPVRTFVGGGDALVSSEPVYIYWVSFGGDIGEDGSVILIDGTDENGSVVWRSTYYNGRHYPFFPPMKTGMGLYVDVDTAAVKNWTVGYLPVEVVEGSERP